MITVYKYLQGNNRNEGRELFTVSENCRPGSNGLKLRKKKSLGEILGGKKKP